MAGLTQEQRFVGVFHILPLSHMLHLPEFVASPQQLCCYFHLAHEEAEAQKAQLTWASKLSQQVEEAGAEFRATGSKVLEHSVTPKMTCRSGQELSAPFL